MILYNRIFKKENRVMDSTNIQQGGGGRGRGHMIEENIDYELNSVINNNANVNRNPFRPPSMHAVDNANRALTKEEADKRDDSILARILSYYSKPLASNKYSQGQLVETSAADESTQQILLHTSHQASLFIDLVPIPMCIIDPTGNILYTNRSFNHTMVAMQTSTSHINRSYNHNTIFDYIYKENLEIFQNDFHKITSENINMAGDYLTWLQSPSSREECLIQEVAWTLKKDPSKSFYVVTCLTCTKTSRAQPDLNIEQRQLIHCKWGSFWRTCEDASMTKKLSSSLNTTVDLMKSIGHDIRTSLNSVYTSLELIELMHKESMNTMVNTASSANSRDMIELIQSTSKICQNTFYALNDLTNFEKFNPHELMLHTTPCNLFIVIKSIIEYTIEQYSHLNIKINLEADNLVTELMVDMDVTKMTNVFRTILRSTVMITPSNQDIYVVLSTHNSPTSAGAAAVLVSFRTSSTHISEEERRTQLYSDIPTLSRHIIRLHNGSIIANLNDSSPGLTYHLELPISDEPSMPAGGHTTTASERDSRKSKRNTSSNYKPTILMPIAFQSNSNSVRQHLSTSEIISLNNNADIIEFFTSYQTLQKESPINAILIDCHSDNNNGLATIRAIRNLGYRDLLFGVVSADGNTSKEHTKIVYESAGVDDIIIFPLNSKDTRYINECLLDMKASNRRGCCEEGKHCC